MAGIYIHIPFCKQACHYCDFHFSTTLKRKPQLVQSLCKELVLRKNETPETIETIYFGGGTPSLLTEDELHSIFEVIYDNYSVSSTAEVTLEANPDDLSEEKIIQFANSKINRLSIGIQSFFDEDLKWMNRSHNAEEAINAVNFARKFFDNITIDLIYGIPGMTDEKWKENLKIALEFDIPHISSYALTVESGTALAKMIDMEKKKPVDDAAAKRHYEILVKTMTAAGYINYEFSNFGLEGYFSQNNTAYWMGKTYLGIGPSAHGFDGQNRYWNVKHNILYAKAIEDGKIPQTTEVLSVTDRYNEYIMTRLRTIWGISLSEIKEKFGEQYFTYFQREASDLFKKGFLIQEGDKVSISEKAKFLGDGISADLFYLE